jgi:hypothetical protein
MRGGAVLGTVVGRAAGATAARGGGSFGVIMLTIAAVAFSVRSLPYGYRYPKQDYVRAVTFIEQTMRSGDVVAVVSDGGDIPVIRYMGRPWTRIDTAEEIDVLRDRGRTVWVLSTFPSYLQSGQPRLWSILTNECEELQKFSGTVEDGSITVRRCP